VAARIQQNALWCACGSLVVNAHGRCARCNRRRRLSQEGFGGLREQVLARDDWRCRVCLLFDDLLVHHRKPGVNETRWLITLCRPCHTRIHATWRPPFGWHSRAFPPALAQLWREAHPDLAEQLPLPFARENACFEQAALFFEPPDAPGSLAEGGPMPGDGGKPAVLGAPSVY